MGPDMLVRANETSAPVMWDGGSLPCGKLHTPVAGDEAMGRGRAGCRSDEAELGLECLWSGHGEGRDDSVGMVELEDLDDRVDVGVVDGYDLGFWVLGSRLLG
jgi:hypothetical protein